MYENQDQTGYSNTNTSENSGYNSGYYDYSGSYGSGYHTGGSNMGQPPKKEKKQKKSGGFLKKVFVAVSLGLFFGICAGAGFFAVESATGMLQKKTAPVVEESKAIEEAGTNMAKTIEGTADALNNTENVQTAVLDISEVAKDVMPAIVSINNTFTQTMSYFGQSMQSESTAAGSGIIVGESDTELLIVSNYHVVEGADVLKIQFADETEAEAQMKGSDSDMDLAVIAVPLDEISATTKDAIAVAALGDSESLIVGEPAIAIGNALGYGQSVTVGVISALNRVIGVSSEASESDASFIQTDAAINPGNSGGALLNLKGEVIGINSNKIGGDVIEGMGYAIPISAAKPIIENLMLKETRAKVTEDNKGYLGISPLTVVQEMTEAYGMPKGVYVSQVYEGTGAEAAGIMKGNIITEFDGNKITGTEDLLRVLEYYAEGDTAEITVMQGSPSGWESKILTVTLSRKPAE